MVVGQMWRLKPPTGPQAAWPNSGQVLCQTRLHTRRRHHREAERAATSKHSRQQCWCSAAAPAASSSAPLGQEAQEQAVELPSGPRKRLIIMRHADSEAGGSARDHERSITDQGRRTASQVAQRLRDWGWLPELVMCSNSRRTRETLESMVEAVSTLRSAETHFRGSLYTIAALDGMTRRHLQEVIMDACRQSMQDCVMCLGHNKGWEEAASSFAGRPVRLGTANAALFEGVGATWREAFQEDGNWRLVDVLVPE